MEFGPVPIAEAEGAILAHSLKTGAGRVAKGRQLSRADIDALQAAGFETVTVARLTADDLDENTAAARIAAALENESLKAGPAGNGRSNLYARRAGLVRLDQKAIAKANLIDEALTAATLPPFTAVVADQLVATVKIITFGANARRVEAVADAAHGAVGVAAYKPRSAALIQTRLPHTTETLLEKTARSTGGRLQRLETDLAYSTVAAHETVALSDAIGKAAEKYSLIVIIGASAIVDRRDVVPSAITAAGGEVLHFGLPVDPGNLTLLARLDETDIVAMPGSARSPREQGSDWILERLAAGLPVTRETITGFAVGGLLKEIRSRPMLRDREAAERKIEPRAVDAILLAAGQSTRMGDRNKLLEPIDDVPMVRKVAQALAASRLRRTIVVTGHESDRISGVLDGLDCLLVTNPAHRDGMGTSVSVGARFVFDGSSPPDAVLVALGDMPDITAGMIDKLISNFDPKTGRTIVAVASGGKRGNPVLWDKRYADDLISLTGDKGARDILREHVGQVIAVDLDDDAVLRDLDTPEALDAYRRQNERGNTA